MIYASPYYSHHQQHYQKKKQQKICNTVVDYACDVCCSRAPNLRFGMSFFSGVGDGTNILFSFFMNDFLFVLFLAAFLVDWIGIQIQCSIVVLHIMYEIHFRPIFLCNSYYMVRCSPLFLSIFFSNAIIHYICVCYLLNHWMHELAPMPVQKASYDFSFLFHSFRPLQLLWMRALSFIGPIMPQKLFQAVEWAIFDQFDSNLQIMRQICRESHCN